MLILIIDKDYIKGFTKLQDVSYPGSTSKLLYCLCKQGTALSCNHVGRAEMEKTQLGSKVTCRIKLDPKQSGTSGYLSCFSKCSLQWLYHTLLCLKLTWMRVMILMKGKKERVLTVHSQREKFLSTGQESWVFRLCDRLWEFLVWLVVWNLQQGWNRSTLNFQVQLCQEENIHKRKGMGRRSHHQSHSSIKNVIVGGSCPGQGIGFFPALPPFLCGTAYRCLTSSPLNLPQWVFHQRYY